MRNEIEVICYILRSKNLYYQPKQLIISKIFGSGSANTNSFGRMDIYSDFILYDNHLKNCRGNSNIKTRSFTFKAY